MNIIRKGELLEVIIPAKWNQFTIDQLLREVWNGPKKQIHQLRTDKAVLLNGEQANWHFPMSTGDRLQIKFFSEKDFGVIPSFQNIVILYEDDHLLVVNKPAGMDTHPNEPTEVNTLANAVAFYLQANGEFRKVQHIHRLDQNTTGAILFAKYSFVAAILDRMLEQREISRIYLAITDGMIKGKKGTIQKPIGRDRHHPTKRRVSPTGQNAVTHYQVLKTFPNQNRTLIQCKLDTGRTHQIRVHLSSIGHPLTGDLLYGGKPGYSRQALHAAMLTFIHPLTNEKIECRAPFLDEPPIFPDQSLEWIKQ